MLIIFKMAQCSLDSSWMGPLAPSSLLTPQPFLNPSLNLKLSLGNTLRSQTSKTWTPPSPQATTTTMHRLSRRSLFALLRRSGAVSTAFPATQTIAYGFSARAHSPPKLDASNDSVSGWRRIGYRFESSTASASHASDAPLEKFEYQAEVAFMLLTML